MDVWGVTLLWFTGNQKFKSPRQVLRKVSLDAPSPNLAWTSLPVPKIYGHPSGLHGWDLDPEVTSGMGPVQLLGQQILPSPPHFVIRDVPTTFTPQGLCFPCVCFIPNADLELQKWPLFLLWASKGKQRVAKNATHTHTRTRETVIWVWVNSGYPTGPRLTSAARCFFLAVGQNHPQ